VGKPNKRERDILFSFREVQYSNKYTFPGKGKYLTATKHSPKNFVLENMPKSVQLYGLLFFVPQKTCPTVCCTSYTVRPSNNKKNPEIRLAFVPKGASKIIPFFLLYESVQQDPAQKMEQHSQQDPA
jgi:hypothetical protein